MKNFLIDTEDNILQHENSRITSKEASLSDKPSSEKPAPHGFFNRNPENEIQEKNLERMEALLSQSAQGVHVLFDNESLALILKQTKDDKDFYDFNKMKMVQDVMTNLIAKKTYLDKLTYLKTLDQESYEMLVRAYFHIVENTVRATSQLSH